MKLSLGIAAFVLIFSTFAHAQAQFPDSLVDHMTGKWIMRGTIDGGQTTHDVDAEWVLAGNYLQVHEVSRERNDNGSPSYEAIVYIAWDGRAGEYQCMWLDVTGGGGLAAQSIGHAKPSGDSLAFLFTFSRASLFHTTFIYDRSTDGWRWIMDGEEDGKLQPFARLELTRD